jgi:hypothetical protein
MGVIDVSPASLGHAALNINLDYRSLLDARFLQMVMSEGLSTTVGMRWVTRCSLDAAPGEELGRAEYFYNATDEVLVRLPQAICHLILHERSLTVRTAAGSPSAAREAADLLVEALPEVGDDDREVPVRFWWWQPNVARDLARMLAAPPWAQITDNYVGATRRRLAEVMDWRDAPPAGGRLLLWHGSPGTGKTSAIRALAGEWRSWAEFHFITDPEEFLRNPSYLLTALDESRRPGSRAPASQWKVMVLEDSGEYLAPDAKHMAGQALSRLLNVCDGVLGQAMRALVLVTTNEPLRTLHPALARPGRCLSEIGFESFGCEDIGRWSEAHGMERPDATTATLADLYAHLDGRVSTAPVGSTFGFSQLSC